MEQWTTFPFHKPTYWSTDTNKKPDMLDFFISKGISDNYSEITPCSDLSSDQSPIILTICTLVIKKDVRAITNRHTDWETFQQHINNNINLRIPLKTERHRKRSRITQENYSLSRLDINSHKKRTRHDQ